MRLRGRAERARQEHLGQRETLLFDVKADSLFQVRTKWRSIVLGRNEAL